MGFRTAPDAFDIWDDVEGVFLPRLNSLNAQLWNGRFWRPNRTFRHRRL
jgi:hypothetical protein